MFHQARWREQLTKEFLVGNTPHTIKNYARLIAENKCIFPVTQVQSYNTTGRSHHVFVVNYCWHDNKLCEGYE